MLLEKLLQPADKSQAAFALLEIIGRPGARSDVSAETLNRDLTMERVWSTLRDIDARGDLFGLTLEHARDRADIPHVTFEQVAA